MVALVLVVDSGVPVVVLVAAAVGVVGVVSVAVVVDVVVVAAADLLRVQEVYQVVKG